MLNLKASLRSLPTWTAVTLTAACLASVVALTTLAAPNGGKWVESKHGNDCPTGMVCADWEVSGEVYEGACCIAPGDLESTNYEACNASFRHGFGGA